MSDVLMPQMGESIVEGTITKWLKKVGETIEQDEPLLEISTDKVDSEVPSPVSGTIEEILADEGATVEINTVIARVSEGGGSAKSAEAPKEDDSKKDEPKQEAPKEEPKQEAPAKEAPKSAAAASSGTVRSSPLVRRIARENNVDLTQVPASGPGGRITKKDIEAYLAAAPKQAASASPAARPAAPSGVAAAATAAFNAFPGAPESRFGDYYVEPLSTMRKRIAEHMVRSVLNTSPHVALVHQIDCAAIVKARAAVKEKFLEQNGVKLTYMPFFMKAAAAALKEFPLVNASLDGEDVVYHRDVNLGIAVALDWGLVVPVVKGADGLSVVGLQKAVTDVAERSRKKQLKPDDLTGSTFSISNFGGFGSIVGTSAINQPNAAILGLGALHKAPVVVGDAIAIRTICYATINIDHRVVDGAVAAQFCEHMKATLENWSESVL